MNLRSVITYVCLMIVVSLFSVAAFSQTAKDIALLYSQRKYEAAMSAARDMIIKEPANPYPYGTIGSVYIKISKYDSAIAFLEKAIQLDNDSTSISGWAHTNLGYAYIYMSKREDGISELKRSITMGTNINCVKSAKRILDSIKYDLPEKQYPKDYMPDWVVIQGASVTYKFQDTIGISNIVYRFIQKHEEAYLKLNSTFEAKPPTKLIMHVWNDGDIAKEILHHSLGFAYSKQCFCHLSRNQSLGHEMTHVLSYWAWGFANSGYSKFIDEGIAVCFNLADDDKYAIARSVIAKEGVENVLDIWKNEKKCDADVLYPVAGAFVTYLQQNSSPEDFKKVIKLQTLDQVRVLYGAQFDKMITDFNHLMGIK